MIKPKILVTGGLGYIGSHTVVFLQKKGYEVFIIDNLSNSNINFLKKIEYITGLKPSFKIIDLNQKDQINNFLKKNKIDGIIHFAAFKYIKESVDDSLLYYDNNINSLINILNAIKDYKLNNFIFSSSCSIYGDMKDKLPLKEKYSSFSIPKSPYARTKKMSEQIIKDYVFSYNKKAISLRYFNPIGAHCSLKIGEIFYKKNHNLVPLIINTAIGNQKYLSIYGFDYPTLDGTSIRDYVHVCDVAKAHVNAIERLLFMNNNISSIFEIFNLGTGIGYSVLQVIDVFEKISGIKLSIKMFNRRKGDVAVAYADTTLALKKLKWKSKYSLYKSINSAWLWGKKNYKKNNFL